MTHRFGNHRTPNNPISSKVCGDPASLEQINRLVHHRQPRFFIVHEQLLMVTAQHSVDESEAQVTDQEGPGKFSTTAHASREHEFLLA